MARVHRITMIVVDHDGLSEADLVDEIKFSLSQSVTVVDHESREIEWSDDSPFNFPTTASVAAERLFRKKEKCNE